MLRIYGTIDSSRYYFEFRCGLKWQQEHSIEIFLKVLPP